ncbi:glycosyltransferase family 4 protein [Aeromonas rivipollensis]|uniref:glycosyltransferase family 4 protein n=1 Tax=Aeromonas rivipollensis TaxID=948519 RepID=UPI003D19F3B2
MSAAFFHDHVFIKVGSDYYSPGKLDYKKMDFYIKVFGSITIVARSKDMSAVPEGYLIANGEFVTVIGMPNLSSIRMLFKRGAIRQRVLGIIESHEFLIARLPSEYGLLCLDVAHRLNRAVLTEVVANAFDCLYYQSNWVKRAYAFLLEYRVRKAVAKSDYVSYVTRQYLQEKYPAARGAMTIGVSDASIRLMDTLPRTISHGASIKLLVIANPDLAIKSVDTAVRAAVLLERQGYSCHLNVLGGDGRNYISKNGALPQNVTFHAAVPSEYVQKFIEQSDIYIQPSLTEGMPRALLEAMSSGVPCCTTPVGGMRDVVHHECLFDKKDYKALVNILIKLMSSEQFYFKMSEHSIEAIKHEFGSREKKDSRADFYIKYRGSLCK